MPLQWSTHMRLHIPQMDAAHQRFLANLRRLHGSPEDELPQRLAESVAGMEQGFALEESLMARLGLPTASAHRAQHAGVLSLLRQAQLALARADQHPARDAIALLPHWFLFHLSTMDMELSVACGLLDGGGTP